jgi:hypothetical protein
MSSNGEKIEEISTRWIDTIKSCVTQQTEQRRGMIKSLDIFISSLLYLKYFLLFS